ncbi:MAG: ParA family protein [Deltaproteobacteria bacterium]|nr:ParA family protein [Deltaproteobacteria bacterium]
MGRIICIANQKGGVGKTTTAINLAASLALINKSTLLIDIDPQGNASSGVGVSGDKVTKNLYHALLDNTNVEEVFYPSSLPLLTVIPSHIDLFGAEIELVNLPQREHRLQVLIRPLRTRFDYIVVDCPPSLGLLTINSLTAADSVLIPVQCEYYALEGLAHLFETLRRIKKSLNPHLSMEGILLTMFDVRNKLCHLVVQDIKKHFDDRVFTSVIPRNVRLSESPSFGKPVYLYDQYSRGAQCYLDLAKEIANKRSSVHG